MDLMRKTPRTAVPKITRPGYYQTSFHPTRCDDCGEIIDGPGYRLITNTNFGHKGEEHFCEKCFKNSEREEIEI